jgi:GT2 family glycosyltransferase
MRRSEFLRIGGFSPLFAPGYWEDYDVSYLALKAGWRNLYSPAAIASHLGQGSMKRAHGSAFINALRRRNFFLFTWMNLSDRDLLNEHLGQLPATLFHATSSGDMNTVRGFFRALPAVSSVVRERERRRSLIRQTDSTVLKGFETHGCRRPEPDPKHLISGVV